jgi:hypothetical protein
MKTLTASLQLTCDAKVTALINDLWSPGPRTGEQAITTSLRRVGPDAQELDFHFSGESDDAGILALLTILASFGPYLRHAGVVTLPDQSKFWLRSKAPTWMPFSQ